MSKSLPKSSPIYATVDKKKTNKKKSPAVYANISASAIKEDLIHQEEDNVESMYSVLQEDTNTILMSADREAEKESREKGSQAVYSVLQDYCDPISLANYTETTKEQGFNKNEDSLLMYSVLQRGSNPTSSKISQFLPSSISTKKQEKRKLPPSRIILVGWLITTIILVTFLAVFIIITAVGYARLAKVEYELNKVRMNNINVNKSINRTPSTFSPITVVYSTTTPMAPPISITVTPTIPPTTNTPISVILANSSYQHLEEFFAVNRHLFGLVTDCESRGQSLDQCICLSLALYGKDELIPAPSCRELYEVLPNNSGYYWVTGLDGTSVRVYCEMNKSCGNITGGLTRVAVINDETRTQYCVGGIMFDGNGCVRRSPEPGCSGILFPFIVNISYTHLCGILEGSSFGTVDGFEGRDRSSSTTINDNYVDGISLTTGMSPNRTHLWTFSARSGNCSVGVPEYVGVYHSCIKDKGACPANCTTMFQREFQNMLSEIVEVRLCQDEHRDPNNEGVFLKNFELYVW